jgi:hypothetical protein
MLGQDDLVKLQIYSRSHPRQGGDKSENLSRLCITDGVSLRVLEQR